ncbi:MAG: hypothetical protein JXB26_03985 [Candidatus Aminicenantes bacterium]|nr:hypothetical protein [Candidatus Aminicenantes bacterium]
MKNKVNITIGGLLFFGIISLASIFLHSQQDYNQRVESAIQEFTKANFDGAINILTAIKDSPQFYTDCPLEEREKALFYLSYCNYLLSGCADSLTNRAMCDLKLHFPKFDTERTAYQWVARDWIDCFQNSVCSDCSIIEHYYSMGKQFFNQDNFLLAAQQLIHARILITTQPPPRNCPEYEQYNNFSSEYLNLTEAKLSDMWNDYFDTRNYEACFEIEKNLANIGSYQDYLQKLSAQILTKKTGLVERVNAASETYNNTITRLLNMQEYSEIDFNSFQESWNVVNPINPKWLENVQLSSSFSKINGQDMLNNFIAYGNFATQKFDLRQEPKVLQTVANFQKFLIANFPELGEQINLEFQKIQNAPTPIFKNTDIGVQSPTRNWEWHIPAPPCVQRENMSGYIRVGIVISPDGKVENVNITENKLSSQGYCSQEFIDGVRKYLMGRKFAPAKKILYKPTSVPITENTPGQRINIYYYMEAKFNLGQGSEKTDIH